jgi:cholesterol oxidase
MAWFRRATGGHDEGAVSFLFGSCLHPGLGTERQRSDSVFETMRPHLKDRTGRRGVDHLLLLGDQIYADATGDLLDPHAAHERFRKRYMEAFGGPTATIGQHAHFIMSHLPTYFSIDDHEIHNDWQNAPNEPQTPELRAREKEALDSAYDFLIHEKRAGERGVFWHDFESAGFPFFAFDTRAERQSDVDRGEVRALISPEQQAGFRAWLARPRDPQKPLFISTGTSLIPLTKGPVETPQLSLKDDGLLGYPAFLSWLVRELDPVKDRRIVWLSGDVHSSSCAELCLTLSDQKSISMIGIASSGLFASLPFINTSSRSYVHEDSAPPVSVRVGEVEITSKQYLLVDDCVSSFVRVDFAGGVLRVQGISGDAAHGAATHTRTF